MVQREENMDASTLKTWLPTGMLERIKNEQDYISCSRDEGDDDEEEEEEEDIPLNRERDEDENVSWSREHQETMPWSRGKHEEEDIPCSRVEIEEEHYIACSEEQDVEHYIPWSIEKQEEENILCSSIKVENGEISGYGVLPVPCASEAIAPTKKRRKTIRRYDPSYLTLGFTWSGTHEEPRPQCVVCGEVLSNGSMKPAHLRRHLAAKHAGLVDQPFDFFLKKCQDLKQSQFITAPPVTPVAKAQEASYRASLLIAKGGMPHSVEQLCLPLAKELTQIMCGEKAAKQLDLVPLSNDTVSRRIGVMADYVKTTLIERIKRSRYYSLQLDETTDVADLASILVYVKYEYNGTAQEDFLFCRLLETRTSAEHIYQLLNAFIEEIGLDWEKCVGFCTDGAMAVTGRHSAVVARIRKVAPKLQWTHCSIHREALAVKKMPRDMKCVLDAAVKIVNVIKSQPVHSRLLNVLCDEMGSESVKLLLNTEIRWLSKGRVLLRLFEWKREAQMILQDKHFILSECLEDPVWLSQLAYLADIFCRLNDFSVGLQALSVNVFNLNDKVNTMLKNMLLFEIKVRGNDVSPFPTLENFLLENNLTLDDGVRDGIAEHLSSLKRQFSECFPVSAEANSWIRNPFNIKVSEMPQDLSLSEKENLTEVSCDEILKYAFKRQSLLDFWIQRQSEYPALSDKAVCFLLPFVTTHLCEKGFSALAAIKTKNRSRIDAEPDLRLKLTSIDPDVEGLCSKKQAHPSH